MDQANAARWVKREVLDKRRSLQNASGNLLDIHRAPEGQNVGYPSMRALQSGDIENSEGQGSRTVGNSVVQTDMQLGENSGARPESSETPRGPWTGVIGAAERLVHIEQTRGPKRRE
jgi:hypothetical protein